MNVSCLQSDHFQGGDREQSAGTATLVSMGMHVEASKATQTTLPAHVHRQAGRLTGFPYYIPSPSQSILVVLSDGPDTRWTEPNPRTPALSPQSRHQTAPRRLAKISPPRPPSPLASPRLHRSSLSNTYKTNGGGLSQTPLSTPPVQAHSHTRVTWPQSPINRPRRESANPPRLVGLPLHHPTRLGERDSRHLVLHQLNKRLHHTDLATHHRHSLLKAIAHTCADC